VKSFLAKRRKSWKSREVAFWLLMGKIEAQEWTTPHRTLPMNLRIVDCIQRIIERKRK
jgi:hypothetical protein